MKTPLFGFLCWLSIGVSHAQRVVVGVKAGVAFTTEVGQVAPSPKVGVLAGFVGGFYQAMPISRSPYFAFQPELLFSMQGYRLSNSDTQYQATLRSYYAAIPLLLTYTRHGFFGEAGPQVSYLAGVRERITHRAITGPGTITNVNTNPNGYPRWDIAYVVGGGYRIKKGLGMEIRYAGGLSSIYHYAGQRHAGLQVLVSYPLL